VRLFLKFTPTLGYGRVLAHVVANQSVVVEDIGIHVLGLLLSYDKLGADCMRFRLPFVNQLLMGLA
jgi:hypothetical protein